MPLSPDYEVQIGSGLGSLSFGTTMEQVKEILGSPGESEVLDPEHNTTELWYYSEPRLQLLFQKETWWEPDPQEQKKKVLVQISTGHPETTLWGRKVMGLSLDEAREILKARFTEKVEEEADCPDGSFPFHSLRDEHVRLSLDFLDRAVTTVLFGNLQLTFPATEPAQLNPIKPTRLIRRLHVKPQISVSGQREVCRDRLRQGWL